MADAIPDDIPEDVMAAYARAMDRFIPPCPGNPFPLSSPWGRQIEDNYRRDVERQRIASAIRSSHE